MAYNDVDPPGQFADQAQRRLWAASAYVFYEFPVSLTDVHGTIDKPLSW